MRSLFITAFTCWIGLSVRAGSFDIAPFAHRCSGADNYRLPTTFDYQYAQNAPPGFAQQGDRFVYALQWAEERDVEQVALQFDAPVGERAVSLEYWFQNWPYAPPTMPTIEDPEDDPWQGDWLTAQTRADVAGTELLLTCLPLTPQENPKALHLPGTPYRRTLKIRLTSREPLPNLRRVQVFTESKQKIVPVRIEFGVNHAQQKARSGRLEAYNGTIRNLRGWPSSSGETVTSAAFHLKAGQGVVFDVVGTDPAPRGSYDATIVSVRAEDRSFSFALADLEKEPMYLPDFDAFITLNSNPESYSPTIIRDGERIRDKLARAPEQTYERARREIPPLDPVERQGGRLYLPLSIDSSWQKFAFEWGGSVFISKDGVKAKGAERRRLDWAGDRLNWRFGTGATPTFRPQSRDSKLRVLDDYLPVATASWRSGEIDYTEEAFAAPLLGPIGLEGRDEQEPVVLLVRFTARNGSTAPQTAHLWLGIRPADSLRLTNNTLSDEVDGRIWAHIRPPEHAQLQVEPMSEAGRSMQGVHEQFALPPGGQDTTVFGLPFIPRLNEAQQARLAALDYEVERSRVIQYWKGIADAGVRFEVPEDRFNRFSRAMLLHMHLSTTRDPKSGLFMVPAASYSYQVFANESCFQILTLDALGDHDTAARYLETFIQLQGSRPFLGTYTDDQRAVYHGAKVDADYDYTASEYNLDHGTVLWTMAEHYFVTRDKAWLKHAAESLIRAADWVTAQRRQTMSTEAGRKVPEYGMLPAGHLEDNADWGHWFAVNAYASAGMTRLADALQDVHHAEASRIRHDADSYRDDLREAVLNASQNAPVTRLRDNRWVPYLPVRPHQRERLFGPLRVEYYSRYPDAPLPTYRLSATREALYGPLILLNLGIFRGDEPVANWILDDWEDNLTMSSSLGLNVHGWVDDQYWFSRGGMVFQANLQNPVLAYLQRQEVPAALRNLYNDFVACLYPEVNAFTEEYRQWRSPSGPFYKVPDEARFVARIRDLLVREDGADLWLTAGTPRRWLAPGQTIRMEQMPTYFGPVDLELKAAQDTIDARVRLPQRNRFAHAWIVLRLPEPRRISSVELNGKPWSQFDPSSGRIRLPDRPGLDLLLRVGTRE
jgi:hypothetical protein